MSTVRHENRSSARIVRSPHGQQDSLQMSSLVQSGLYRFTR
ncbi:hypothetical protein [Acidilobus sp.]